jgi:Lar family restriction alleviation protein
MTTTHPQQGNETMSGDMRGDGVTGDQRVPLLPCPFCGGKPEMTELGDPDSYAVQCTGCEVQQIANYTPSVAAERWNKRTAADGTHTVEIPPVVRWTDAGHA